MNAEEYVASIAKLQKKIDNLYKRMNRIDVDYYFENVPFPIGTIIQLFFKDGGSHTGIIGSMWEVDKKTGEFRPNIFKVNREGACSQKIHYDWHRAIDHIEKIGEGAKCKDCLFRELHGDKYYCGLQVKTGADGEYHAVSIDMDQPMCSTGKYVEWRNNVPWGAKFKIKK